MSGVEPELVDFNVTDILHVVERLPDTTWHVTRSAQGQGSDVARVPVFDEQSPEVISNNNYYILGYALSGSALYTINGKHYTIRKNDLVFIKQGSSHTARSNPNDPWHFYSLSFFIQFNNEATRQFVHSLPDIISGYTIKLLPVLMDEANKVWVSKRTGYLIQCRGLIMQALYLLICSYAYSKNNITRYEDVERVISVLQGNYVENYTNDQLAQMANLSCSHFRALFRAITGMSPVNYQIQMKINKAQSLLLTGQYSVSQISMLLGFKDIYYFSRMFKKYTGVSPSGYRQS
ncbi:MAG: AraC family transcriptional regulator [Bacillota bacterium]|nr:AraC family transcriptional regulator [Bacillota bacterium]